MTMLAAFFLSGGEFALAADTDPLDAIAGKALFDRNWIPAPSSTDGSDGLGPYFTARSCVSCHAGGGGAHVAPSRNDPSRDDIAGAVLRFGRADGSADPYYGRQLQTDAVPGLVPEGSAHFLPELSYHLNGPPLASGVKAGVRIAPPLHGRGAFDQISDEEILKRADPDDKNGDGIRGRANRTADGIGRFGWKASQVTLEDQVADAFSLDIGLSSPKAPHPYGDCTKLQTACLGAPNGESKLFDGREISATMLRIVANYIESLKPRALQDDSAGARIFDATGCAQCHVPSLKARDGSLIPAFTDLLLHDMGSALDDGVGEPGVASSEWRTAPLIGGGNRGPRRYLHDGSAATVDEAVAKHGGEAARSREQFGALKAEDKLRLIEYVNGL